MKRFALLAIFASFSIIASARDTKLTDKLLSLLSMAPTETTPANISTLFGKPDEIEQGGRQSIWHYTSSNATMHLYWDGKIFKLQRLIFSALSSTERVALDNDKAKQLRSGETALADAVKILGVPKELEIKGANQQLHYTFKENKLNLFFRNGTLVNYTLF